MDGATNPDVSGVEVSGRAALAATAVDVLRSDAFILGTPANLGYMSGALKHFFDTVYYPCLNDTRGRLYGCFVHGNDDTQGAIRSIEKVTSGLGWVPAAAPVSVTGTPTNADVDACWELGATVAARLAEGI